MNYYLIICLCFIQICVA